jgi:hypothetical protein
LSLHQFHGSPEEVFGPVFDDGVIFDKGQLLEFLAAGPGNSGLLIISSMSRK